MEEGGEIEPLYNEYNKDHLATIADTLKTRGKTYRQWYACGFNGFSQLKFENKRKLLQFEDLQIPSYFDNVDDVLVSCSWNCLAVAYQCSLYLQGFISNCQKTSKSIETEQPIKFLDTCDKFCLLLTENGKVYKLALGSKEALKEIQFQITLTPIIPQKRTLFGDTKVNPLQIAHIACGNNITIAVSTTNSVFSGTIEIYQFPKHERTKQLQCGFEHALLLTSNGDIYAWGSGLRGQMGLAVLRVVETPTLIDALAGIKITCIAAGGWHSAAISAFGDLYTWGFNSNGQLGLRLYKTTTETIKEPSVYPLPQLIDISACQCNKDSCCPIQVVVGGRHTILLMKCGSINACGWNAYGQLGLKKVQQYCDNFEFVFKIKDETNINSIQIICGNWCTLIRI